MYGENASILATTMVIFRLTHFVGSLILASALFGPKGISEPIDVFLTGSSKLRSVFIDSEFVRDNILVISMLAVLSLGDVTMMHSMPWRATAFHQRAKVSLTW